MSELPFSLHYFYQQSPSILFLPTIATIVIIYIVLRAGRALWIWRVSYSHQFTTPYQKDYACMYIRVASQVQGKEGRRDGFPFSIDQLSPFSIFPP
jgi:hypothetical protein